MEVPRWMKKALHSFDPDYRVVWMPHAQRWGIYHLVEAMVCHGEIEPGRKLYSITKIPHQDFVWCTQDGGFLPLDLRLIEYLAEHDRTRVPPEEFIRRIDAHNDAIKRNRDQKFNDLVTDMAGYYRQACVRDADGVAPRHASDLPGSYDKSLARAF